MADDKNTGVVTTCDLIPNLGEAIEFLKGWGIAEPVLSASHTEPGTGKKGLFESHQFKLPFSWDDVQAWIAARQRNGNWSNIYFNVNPAHSGVDKKMDRSDIGAMVALHVDADAAPMPQDFKEGGAAWQAQEIVRLTKLLQNYKHPPSDIIISGGGVQGYWRLKDPEPVNGDVTIAEDLKLYNKGLERDLGTDATHNLDRVMRVPGTVNIPTASKLPKGRVPALSRVYSHTAVTYDLGQFEKAPPDAVPELKGLEAGGRYIDAGQFERIASNDGRLVNLEQPWLRLGMEGDYDGKFTGLDGKCDRSRMALAFVTQCIRAGIEDGVIASIIMDANWKVGECIRDKAGETKRQLKRLLERAHKFVNEDVTKPAFLGLETWGSTANKFLIRKCPDLAYWNGDFYNYRNGVYKIYEDAYVHSMVRMFLDESVCSGGEDKPPIPFNPNNNDVNETLGFVKDKCYLPRDAMTPPCYRFEDPTLPRARDCLNLRNCILHVPTGATAEHTPDFFTTSISDYDFDALADCPIWKKVLNDWWPPCDDGTVPMEQMLLQEMIGYSLLPRTDLQKIFAITGPGGSGKGTIQFVISKLVGEDNVITPSLGSLTQTSFGIMPLVNKTIALIGEAQFGPRDDRTSVTNLLKTVSGEDKVTFDRKNKEHWVGYLLVRFWLFCNSIPQFDDAGKALLRRLIPLEMKVSFVEKPDKKLKSKLEGEIAGILNWALEGLARLNANDGEFTMPPSSIAKREQFGRLASGVQNFIEDCCENGEALWASEDDIYSVYEIWCDKNGSKPKPKPRLLEELVSFDPQHYDRKRKSRGGRDNEERVRAVTGLGLKVNVPAKRETKGKAGEAEIPF